MVSQIIIKNSILDIHGVFCIEYCSFHLLIPCLPGIALLCIIPIPANQKLLLTSIVIAGKFFVTIAFAILFFYTNEIFPTVIRGTGVGTSEMICRDNTGGADTQICGKQYRITNSAP